MSSHVIEADDGGDEHPDHGSKVNEIRCGPRQDQILSKIPLKAGGRDEPPGSVRP
jgi:hypothetical protein